MLKPVIDFGRKVVALVSDARNTTKLSKNCRMAEKKTHEKFDRLSERVDLLSHAFEPVLFDLRRQQDKMEDERRIHRLEIENLLLRQGRQLPPPPPADPQSPSGPE